MKLNKLAEAMAWLPGYLPNEVVVPSAAPAVPASISTPTPQVWPTLDTHTFTGLSGEVTKYEANLSAIELLYQLETDDRAPTEQERTILNRYTGWGGLAKAFNMEQRDEAWAARSAQLRALLAADDHRAAEDSTPNAHYTSIEVIQAVYQAVQRLGFNGGRILDPSAGTGFFLGGMPKAVAERSQITAVELDRISSRILGKLYKDYGVKTLQGAFESTQLPNGYFDLAISNVPFGNYKVAELRNVPYANFSIHNYFFARSLELVRPGGLVAFITSSSTMDMSSDKIRHYLASKGDLVAALRLPTSTFQSIAGTTVTTDLIIMQRPLTKTRARQNDWMNLVDVPTDSPLREPNNRYARHTINEYYVTHPEHHLGAVERVFNGFAFTTGCVLEGDLIPLLHKKVVSLPEGIYADKTRNPATPASAAKILQLDPCENHRPGFRLIKGVVYTLLVQQAIEHKAPKKTLERIAGLIAVRDAARALIAAQMAKSDSVVADYRLALNVAYDAYTSIYGFLSSKVSRAAFKGDPDLPLLLSLENWDNATQSAQKTDIFHRRTVGVHSPVLHCESTQDAMLVSLVEFGYLNPAHIGNLVGMPSDDAMKELEEDGLVYLDPESDDWVTADEYLSGQVRHKLKIAHHAGGRFAWNASALAQVIPPDLSPQDISARIGSTWIPVQDYDAFLNLTLNHSENEVSFCKIAGAWDVRPDYQAQHDVASTQTYGTGRVNAVTLFEMALNQVVPTVYDTDFNGNRLVNHSETIAAREKQHELKERFVAWLWEDNDRATRLVRLYNDTMNATVARQYDGSHLVLPGYSGVHALHPHQKDAIWRIVVGGRNTLLAHTVGAGKTLTMICAAMELRRLGKINKALMVVPNHMLEQFSAEFLRAYPSANLLMASKEDLVGDKRRQLLSRIATGNWDAVIITHASFERIKMSTDFMREFIDDEIQMIQDAIRAASDGSSNKIVKQLARARRSWEARLAKLENSEKKDDLLTYEELGVDWLFVDEAHYFKNLYRHTKMSRVAGLPNSNSERAFDMFCKTRQVMAQHHDMAGVVFATGTPVSNSMAELWVMQRYLQPMTLDGHHIEMFDTWAGNFGESVTALELSPDGAGYRMQTRFARFVNLPELMAMFSEVADIRTAEMLNLPVPKAEKHTVTCQPSLTLKRYIGDLVKRAEKIRNGEVRPSVDNMLAVTNDGRKAALDIRLVMDGAKEDADNKTHQAAERIIAIYHEGADEKGAQVVFCDLSTPKEDGSFNSYSDLKFKLISGGIPEHEIAFIHDAHTDLQKESLFAAVRAGAIRVIMGSTLKMGVGTNIQERLVALHHLDAPWRPSDVEQREGRIIRQGNLFDRVAIFRYVTAGSFDAYIWQTLENKARFIAQIMAGNTATRHAEDVELAALSFAEVKALASGNPMVLEKAGVDSELAKLNVLKAQWARQIWINKQELIALPEQITRHKARLSRLEADAALAAQQAKIFTIEINGAHYNDGESAGAALLAIKNQWVDSVVGHYAGFSITFQKDRYTRKKHLVLTGQASHMADYFNNAKNCISVLHRVLAVMVDQVEAQKNNLAREESRMRDIQASIKKGFEHHDRIAVLSKRQREIEGELDLSKGDHGACDDQAEAA